MPDATNTSRCRATASRSPSNRRPAASRCAPVTQAACTSASTPSTPTIGTSPSSAISCRCARRSGAPCGHVRPSCSWKRPRARTWRSAWHPPTWRSTAALGQRPRPIRVGRRARRCGGTAVRVHRVGRHQGRHRRCSTLGRHRVGRRAHRLGGRRCRGRIGIGRRPHRTVRRLDDRHQDRLGRHPARPPGGHSGGSRHRHAQRTHRAPPAPRGHSHGAAPHRSRAVARSVGRCHGRARRRHVTGFCGAAAHEAHLGRRHGAERHVSAVHRGNTGEVFPRVMSALGGTLMGDDVGRSQMEVFREIGFVTRRDLEGIRLGTGVFGGYLYSNASLARLMGVRTPGMGATMPTSRCSAPPRACRHTARRRATEPRRHAEAHVVPDEGVAATRSRARSTRLDAMRSNGWRRLPPPTRPPTTSC